MKRYKIQIIGMLLLCFVQQLLGADIQFGTTRTDSLQSYLETAWRQNPSIQQKWSDYQAALQKVPQVSALPDPTLDLGVFLQPMELPGGNQIAEVQLMQMFPWFGVLRHAKDEMSLMAKAAFTTVLQAKLDVAYEVRTAWYELYRNREQARLTDENLAVLIQLERLAVVRYGAGGVPSGSAGGGMSNGQASTTTAAPTGMSGMGGGAATNTSSGASSMVGAAASSSNVGMSTASGSLIDLYDLQQEKWTLHNQRASLDDAFKNLCTRFNLLLNREATAEITLPPQRYADQLQLPSDTLFSRNPMLQMLAFERESLEAKRKMAERMGYPMVGIGLKYSMLSKNPASSAMMNGQDMLMPMLSVSLPIYRKKYKAAQQEAAWQRKATEQGYEAMRNNLQTDYEDLKFQNRDAERRLQLAENQLQLTQKSYQLQRSRFAASTGSLEEVIKLGRRLLDVHLQAMNAQVDKLVAQAGIRRITAIE